MSDGCTWTFEPPEEADAFGHVSNALDEHTIHVVALIVHRTGRWPLKRTFISPQELGSCRRFVGRAERDYEKSMNRRALPPYELMSPCPHA
jgi:hypothetical protein